MALRWIGAGLTEASESSNRYNDDENHDPASDESDLLGSLDRKFSVSPNGLIFQRYPPWEDPQKTGTQFQFIYSIAYIHYDVKENFFTITSYAIFKG